VHRCDLEASAGAVALLGRTAAGPVALLGGAAILGGYLLAAAEVWRWGPLGLGGVLVAGALAQAAVLVRLRPAVCSCSVRRSVMGAFFQLTLVTAVGIALNG